MTQYKLREWINPHDVYSSPALSANPHPMAIDYLEANPSRINSDNLSLNPSDWAMDKLEKNLDKVNWSCLIQNPSDRAFKLIKANPDRYKEPHSLFGLINHPHPDAFEYLTSKIRMADVPRNYGQSNLSLLCGWINSAIGCSRIKRMRMSNELINFFREYEQVSNNQLKNIEDRYEIKLSLQEAIFACKIHLDAGYGHGGIINHIDPNFRIDVIEHNLDKLRDKLKEMEHTLYSNPNIFIEVNPKKPKVKLSETELLKQELVALKQVMFEQHAEITSLKNSMTIMQNTYQEEIAALEQSMTDQLAIHQQEMLRFEKLITVQQDNHRNDMLRFEQSIAEQLASHQDQMTKFNRTMSTISDEWKIEKQAAEQDIKSRQLTEQINDLLIRKYIDDQLKEQKAELLQDIDRLVQKNIPVEQLSQTIKNQFDVFRADHSADVKTIVSHYELIISQLHKSLNA